MEIVLQSLFAVIQTFLIFGLGALLVHLKFLKNGDIETLSKLTLDVLIPILTVSAIVGKFTREEILDLWQLPVLGFCIVAFGACAGFVFRKFIREKTPSRVAMFHHFCSANNYLFLPFIILDNLWGAHYVGLLLIMHLGLTIGFWTLGVACFGGVSFKNTVRNIFSINFYAVVTALTLVFFDIKFPSVVAKACTALGDSAIPLVLLSVGAAIYSSAKRLHLYLYDIILLSLVRLIIIPLAIIGALKLIPLSQEVMRVASVVALMPVSSRSVLIAQRFGGDADMAAQAIIFTTLLSLITIPILLPFIA